VIEADYNGVRERDGERAPYHQLFYQMIRMVRAKGALAQDDRIDALAARLLAEHVIVDGYQLDQLREKPSTPTPTEPLNEETLR
jgi:hypothetical protein